MRVSLSTYLALLAEAVEQDGRKTTDEDVTVSVTDTTLYPQIIARAKAGHTSITAEGLSAAMVDDLKSNAFEVNGNLITWSA